MSELLELSVDKEKALQAFRTSDNRRLSKRIDEVSSILLADIEPGKEWTAEELSGLLKLEPKTQAFGLAVSEINRAFGRRGYVLTSRGFNGTRWKVLEVDRNRHFINMKCRAHLRGIKECAILASATVSEHAEKLSDSERRKLEKQAEIMALRYIMAKRIR